MTRIPYSDLRSALRCVRLDGEASVLTVTRDVYGAYANADVNASATDVSEEPMLALCPLLERIAFVRLRDYTHISVVLE